MKLKTLLLGAGLGIGVGLAAASPAAAYIVCNRDGDCWHTDRRVIGPHLRFEYHPDDWYFHRDWDRDRDRHWHGYREDRGYWRGGVWVPL